jgi:hypothetical protein
VVDTVTCSEILRLLRLTEYPELALSGNIAAMAGCHLSERRRVGVARFPVIWQLRARGRIAGAISGSTAPA